ncbi:MAG: hypothetical protein ABR529_10985 [Actinomycetota bacterium]
MTTIHRFIAYAIPTGWALLALAALVCFVRNRPPGEWFWKLLAGLQVILGIQAAVGAVLFLSGRVPASNGPSWLHYAYGALFPLAVLVAAHRFARRQEGISWVVFGGAALVIFGLTFRALQTGLGID